jgi:aminoglycoside phosphotransferase (APT) family kinase protein
LFGGLIAASLAVRGVVEISKNFDGPVGQDIPADVRQPDRLVSAIRALAGRVATPSVLLHGDAHIGNVFLDEAGRPALVDWQCVQIGEWGLDVGYHIASALATKDRERSERTLLEHYLDHLRANGVDAPSHDAAWEQYRRGIAYGFFMWAITLHVEAKIIAVLLQRLGAAAAAHDCLAIMDESPKTQGAM